MGPRFFNIPLIVLTVNNIEDEDSEISQGFLEKGREKIILDWLFGNNLLELHSGEYNNKVLNYKYSKCSYNLRVYKFCLFYMI
jgi:hypothetical protein